MVERCLPLLQSPRNPYVWEGHYADTLRHRRWLGRARQPHPQLSAPMERRAHKTKMTALCSGRVLGLAPHQRERDHGELGCVSSFLTFFLIAVSGSHFVTTSAADVFEGHVADPLMQRTPGMAPLILSLPCSRSRAGEPFLAQRGARSDLAAKWPTGWPVQRAAASVA